MALYRRMPMNADTTRHEWHRLPTNAATCINTCTNTCINTDTTPATPSAIRASMVRYRRKAGAGTPLTCRAQAPAAGNWQGAP